MSDQDLDFDGISIYIEYGDYETIIVSRTYSDDIYLEICQALLW